MANRRIEMHQYRQVIHRMRQGQSDRAITKTQLIGRHKCAVVRSIATEKGWLDNGPLPNDQQLATLFDTRKSQRENHQSLTQPYEDKIKKLIRDHFVLKLVPHDSDSEYSSQKLWVRRDNFVPQTIEFYDRAGRLCKKLIGRDIEKIDGYWVVREQEMIDLLANHRTRMVLRQVRFDSGLSDNLFTERHLQR